MITKDRLTNLFKHDKWFDLLINQQGVIIYVVVFTLIRSEPFISIRNYACESPKVVDRREAKELGISRNMKIWGRRRIHSTALKNRKESSLVFSPKYELSGLYKSEELYNLLNNVNNNSLCTNLSMIMSDPKFLIACWINIKSKLIENTEASEFEILDKISIKWFEDIAKSFRNGSFQFKSINKLKPLFTISLKDKIVIESMRFLLTTIFEPTFKNSCYGFKPNRGYDSALYHIKMKFSETNWFIEGNINQQFQTINHNILIKLIETRIKDQPFIDLLWKYIRSKCDKTVNSIKPININVIQGGNLLSILSNIYMHPFDVWMEDQFTFSSDSIKYKKKNPIYLKINRGIQNFDPIITNHKLKSGLWNNHSFKKIEYIRYTDNFLIGVTGNKQECIELQLKIKNFLENELQIKLNIDKIKITHSSKGNALFLKYNIHIAKFKKISIRYNKLRKLTRITSRLQLNGPISQIVKKLKEKGFVNKRNSPTRNGKFIALNLAKLVNYYKTIEKDILSYYSFANNYTKIAAKVHYILKYSCALTIASKMKLKTLRKVFRKYGKDLNIKNENGKIITNYPTVSNKRPQKINVEKWFI
jgi:retron-type reverse transcriptase